MSTQAALTLCFAVFASCTERATVDGTLIVTFASWVRVTAIAACPIAVLVGLRLPRSLMKWRITLPVLAVIGATIVVPGVFRDRVEVDDGGFRLRTGFWFAPTVATVRFSDAKGMVVPLPQVSQKHRTPIVVALRSGETQTVSQSDLVAQCLDDIVVAATKAGVRVVRTKPQ